VNITVSKSVLPSGKEIAIIIGEDREYAYQRWLPEMPFEPIDRRIVWSLSVIKMPFVGRIF